MKSSNWQHKVERWLEQTTRIERAVSGAAFLVLILAVFIDVLSREFTGAGLHWARQTGVYANVFVVMLGLGLASAAGANLRPRFADGWLPARFTPLLERANHVGMAAFCIAFAIVAMGLVGESYALQERSMSLRIPVWPFQLVVPVAFLLTGVRQLAYAVFPALRPPETGALAAGSESLRSE